jgi:hypothetical protein
MTSPVSGQKINLASANLSANERVRGCPKWRVDVEFAGVAQFFYLIQAAASDDPNCWRFVFLCGHVAI